MLRNLIWRISIIPSHFKYQNKLYALCKCPVQMPCANALYPWINRKRKPSLLHSMISSQHLIQSLHLSMAFAYLSCVLFCFFFIYIWINSSCMISLHDGINNIFLSISPSLKCSFQKVFRKWPAKDFQDVEVLSSKFV